jgi:hypothetical protein
VFKNLKVYIVLALILIYFNYFKTVYIKANLFNFITKLFVKIQIITYTLLYILNYNKLLLKHVSNSFYALQLALKQQ